MDSIYGHIVKLTISIEDFDALLYPVLDTLLDDLILLLPGTFLLDSHHSSYRFRASTPR